MFALHIALTWHDAGLVLPLHNFIPTLLMTYVFAELSYRFYESPFLRLKRRYSVT